MNEGISICLPLIWMGLPWTFTSRRTGFSAPALARTHFMNAETRGIVTMHSNTAHSQPSRPSASD